MSADHGAATITVRQTVDLLDGPFATVADGISEGHYAFWLGSGISFGRLAGLNQIVPKVVEFVRARIDPNEPTCPYAAGMEEVFDLAGLSDAEKTEVNRELPFSDWPNASAITSRLVTNYARLLDIQIDGQPEDHILWDGIDVSSTFADPAVEPDVEHLCIAILVLEGVVTVIASANWDGLIERAIESLTDSVPTLVACVRSEDLQLPDLSARLLKFHGCAVKASQNEADFRPYLVGRQSQINRWIVNPSNAGMVDRLTTIIATKPTLMIGLSAQDANIQSIFAHASVRLGWAWPGDRPSYVFSQNAIGPDQRGLLQNVYRDAYTAENRMAIEDSALIRAYAKPLLIALVLHVLCQKLQTLIDLAPEALDAHGKTDLKAGVIALRNALADSVGADPLKFTESLIEGCGHAQSMFRQGRRPMKAGLYKSVTRSPVQGMAGDPGLAGAGMHEAAIAAGILGKGVSDRLWTLKGPNVSDQKAGVAEVLSKTGPTKIFVAANGQAALRLRLNGLIEDEDNAILIHSLEIVDTMARSPRGALGRTGHPTVREVSITELLVEATSADNLLRRFREEVAL